MEAAVAAAGLSSARHVRALRSAGALFTAANTQRAVLGTGVALEFSLLAAGEAEASHLPEEEELPEERLVLLMGFLQTKEQWAPVLDLLLERWDAQARGRRLRVLALDNRGVGGSDAPLGRYTTSQMARDTLALMDHVGWRAAHVAGVSMGGMVALELAAAAPERVRSLTLMVTTRGRYRADLRSWKPLLGSIFARSTRQGVDNVLALIYPPKFLQQEIKDHKELVRAVLEKYHATRPSPHGLPTFTGMLGQAFACQTHYVSDERLAVVRDAGFPILIIGCMEDILIPPGESIKLSQILSGGNVETLFFKDGGHGVFFQFMEEVANALPETFQRSKL